MKFTSMIIEYIGKIDKHIMVIVNVGFDNNYYESTFIYDNDTFVFTASQELNNMLGHQIEEDEDYIPLMRDIYNKVVKYNEMFNRLDDFDINKWQDDVIESTSESYGTIINNADIKEMDDD